ncbi:MAG: succinyl-diaminopimelate desuccinylase [Actinomyces sp.]|uniref:succinyl-diaminopimelate desuccinylase n=1 Tax=Actinomyces sp. TaxID=29317 RepID=UPI0026DAEFB5|nr:succinyl-diaminopimelate desuccinylase [Actinomyces sp.]MDO4242371.1 succinyl-diaminopimelate desuccinylase [Actinomyces sp.]
MTQTVTPSEPEPAPVVLPDLAGDLGALTLALVNAPSVSGGEAPLADAVEAALGALGHLEVRRHGNTVVARTRLGRPERVIIAGHLDTVPVSLKTANVPGRLEECGGEPVVWGRGSVDMKGGVAVCLHLAATLTAPTRDVTWVFYDNEEVNGDLNGLGLALEAHPDWFAADLAILCEPTGAVIEGGCNGTLRLVLDVPGSAAHSARSWRGANAIHAAGELIARAAAAPVRTVEVDGLAYRESFNVVLIEGGIAMNTIPDSCRLHVNYRYAPDLDAREALDRALRIMAGRDPGAGGEPSAIEASTGPVTVRVDDLCEAARPGLDSPLAAGLVAVVRDSGGTVGPKYGWTDVARFSAAGIPAVNLGPGDPMLCHTDDEHCPVSQVERVTSILRTWLG